MDLYARGIVGWLMMPTMNIEIVVDASFLDMTCGQPSQSVKVHSNHGYQFGSSDG